MIKKLTAERDSKRSQHTSAIKEVERKKAVQDEGMAQAEAEAGERATAAAVAIQADAVEPVQMAAKPVVVKAVVEVEEPLDAEDSEDEDGDGMDVCD